ncbi:hypothetical protein [uncultured Methanoregula sp.]|uniref:diacylglycerol/polyprenol kinase family protein n=1 Tax=uncultured Methanoregula sp. TaxID=1005933 RepID=UPI002AAC486C|nr:hypothetical protein [uncultured Methanoregula sp.]
MREIFRKLVHILFGLGVAGLVIVFDRPVAMALLAAGLLIGVVLIDILLRGYHIPLFSFLVDFADRGDCLPGRGALFFAVSALACIILFPAPVAVPALVTIAVLDGVATLVGVRFGRIRIFNGKSLEGTTAGIVVTALVLLPFLTVPGAIFVSVIAGLIELLSPIDDNLVITPCICVLLELLPVLIRTTA